MILCQTRKLLHNKNKQGKTKKLLTKCVEWELEKGGLKAQTSGSKIKY